MNLDFAVQMDSQEKQSYGQTQQSNSTTSIYADDINKNQNLQQNQNLGACGCFSVAYYQPYFNVSQEDVLSRLQLSILPIRSDFLQNVKLNPDLWGPFWICTTLILLIAASGNFMRQLYFWINPNDQVITYNFDFVPVAATLLYCVAFGTPVILTVLMKCYQCEISLFQTICLYGYSMVPLVPITLLCTIPNGVFIKIKKKVSIMVFNLVWAMQFMFLLTQEPIGRVIEARINEKDDYILRCGWNTVSALLNVQVLFFPSNIPVNEIKLQQKVQQHTYKHSLIKYQDKQIQIQIIQKKDIIVYVICFQLQIFKVNFHTII